MLHKAHDLIGRTLQAKDGLIGEVRDYFFDDKYWALRYLVVDTSSWGDNREVLISPACFQDVDWLSGVFPTNLTRGQVKNSPDIDADPPLSSQHEAQLIQYWGWPSREFPDMMYSKAVLGAASDSRQTAVLEKETDPYLHSWAEVADYSLVGADGVIGRVLDLIVDDTCWAIRYLAVETSELDRTRRTLVPAEWVEKVTWGENAVHISAGRELIAAGPEYDASRAPDRAFEEKLCAHYGLPGYWRGRRNNAEKT